MPAVPRESVNCERCSQRYMMGWKEPEPHLCGICRPRDSGINWAAIPPTHQANQRNAELENRPEPTAEEKFWREQRR